MSWAAVIGGIIQLVLLILSKSLESNAENKKKKEEIIKELQSAIKSNDPSAITLALSKLR